MYKEKKKFLKIVKNILFFYSLKFQIRFVDVKKFIEYLYLNAT